MNSLVFYRAMMQGVRAALADPTSPLNQWWDDYNKHNPMDWETLREDYAKNTRAACKSTGSQGQE